jgi:hypothetical protein
MSSYTYDSWDRRVPIKSYYEHKCEQLAQKRYMREADKLSELESDKYEQKFNAKIHPVIIVWNRYKINCERCGKIHPYHPTENLCRFGVLNSDDEDTRIKQFKAYYNFVSEYIPVSKYIEINKIDVVKKAIRDGRIRVWTPETDGNIYSPDDITIMIKYGRIQMIELVLKNNVLNSNSPDRVKTYYCNLIKQEIHHLDYEYYRSKTKFEVFDEKEFYAEEMGNFKKNKKIAEDILGLFGNHYLCN